MHWVFGLTAAFVGVIGRVFFTTALSYITPTQVLYTVSLNINWQMSNIDHINPDSIWYINIILHYINTNRTALSYITPTQVLYTASLNINWQMSNIEEENLTYLTHPGSIYYITTILHYINTNVTALLSYITPTQVLYYSIPLIVHFFKCQGWM